MDPVVATAGIVAALLIVAVPVVAGVALWRRQRGR